MANVYATKNGNWSDTTVWNTGSLPTTSDDVFTNTFTVTVNQNITVLSLRNTTASGISAGGSFNFTTSGVTANITGATPVSQGSSTPPITISHSGGSVTLNMTSPLISTHSQSWSSVPMIDITGNGDAYITAQYFTGGAGTASTLYAIRKGGSGTLYSSGNIIAGSSTNQAQIVILVNAGSMVHVGNVTGAVGGTVNSAGISFNGTNLSITGDLSGGINTTTSMPVSVTSASAVNITGNIIGGACTSGCLFISNSSSTSIVGNVSGGTTSAIISSNGISVTVTGNITATSTATGIALTNASGSVNLSGNMQNTNGKQAIFCQNLFISNSSTTQWRCYTSGGADRTLYSADTFPNSPATGDVRDGTTYGAGLSLTGTLKVPSPANVLSGVQTDNTVGTYTTTPALIATEIFTKLLSSTDFNTSGSFGKLIKDNVDAKISDVKTSTDRIPTHPASVETTGDQVSSYGV